MALRAAQKPRPFTAAIHRLSACSDPACLLDCDGTILFVNDAWERFGRENGAGDACNAGRLVGQKLVDSVAGEEPRRMFRMLLARVLRGAGPAGERGAVQTSECNGPDVARLVTTRFEPVFLSAGAPIGVAMIHRTVRERPVAEVYPVVEAGERGWRDGAGVLLQCSCCRRTRRPGDGDEWDFVPGLLVAAPADTTWGYCPLCQELHHAGVAAQDESGTFR